jgi:uncharacterized OB-fold protein
MEWVEMPTHGKLAAFTVIYIGPSAMTAQGYGRDNPYVSGIVELPNGSKISARISGVDAHNPAAIQVGTPVMLDLSEAVEGKLVQLAFRVE